MLFTTRVTLQCSVHFWLENQPTHAATRNDAKCSTWPVLTITCAWMFQC